MGPNGSARPAPELYDGHGNSRVQRFREGSRPASLPRRLNKTLGATGSAWPDPASYSANGAGDYFARAGRRNARALATRNRLIRAFLTAESALAAGLWRRGSAGYDRFDPQRRLKQWGQTVPRGQSPGCATATAVKRPDQTVPRGHVPGLYNFRGGLNKLSARPGLWPRGTVKRGRF